MKNTRLIENTYLYDEDLGILFDGRHNEFYQLNEENRAIMDSGDYDGIIRYIEHLMAMKSDVRHLEDIKSLYVLIDKNYLERKSNNYLFNLLGDMFNQHEFKQIGDRLFDLFPNLEAVILVDDGKALKEEDIDLFKKYSKSGIQIYIEIDGTLYDDNFKQITDKIDDISNNIYLYDYRINLEKYIENNPINKYIKEGHRVEEKISKEEFVNMLMDEAEKYPKNEGKQKVRRFVLNLFNNEKQEENEVKRVVDALFGRKKIDFYCPALAEIIAMDSSCNLYVCKSLNKNEHFIGNVLTDNENKLEDKLAYFKTIILPNKNNEVCRKCISYFWCDECLVSFDYNNKNIFDIVPCESRREVTNEVILILFSLIRYGLIFEFTEDYKRYYYPEIV